MLDIKAFAFSTSIHNFEFINIYMYVPIEYGFYGHIYVYIDKIGRTFTVFSCIWCALLVIASIVVLGGFKSIYFAWILFLKDMVIWFREGVGRGSHQRNTSISHAETHGDRDTPDSKVHGANMGPIWGQQGPGGPHVGPMNFAIWGSYTRVILDHAFAVYAIDIFYQISVS